MDAGKRRYTGAFFMKCTEKEKNKQSQAITDQDAPWQFMEA